MGAPLRVLLVEDVEDDALLVIRELRRCGYTPAWERVQTGDDVEDAVTRGGWDIVLSDFSLPGLSAPEVLRICRRVDPDVPFIIVSGTIGEQEAVDALRAGAGDFVTKQNMARLGPAIARELREADDRRARREAERRQRETEQRYRMLVDKLPAVTYLASWQPVGTALFINDQVEALTGVPAAELVDRPGAWLELVHRDDRGRVADAYRRRREVGAFPVLEYKIAARDGSVRWVRETANLLYDGDGRPWAIQGLLTDLTEARSTEQELVRQREALVQTEKLAAMGTLLAGVAHELNNPLSVVHGQASLLKRHAGQGPLAERAEKILVAAERCARIVRNFLALARQQPAHRQSVHLNAVVQEAVELLAYPLRVESIAVELRLAPSLPTVHADAHQLHQVLVNLVSNAHHALRDTPPPRRITVSTRHDADRGHVVVEVADSGPGIPAEIRSRIFDPFFTTKPAGLGTGLGLSLCRGILESHGGTVTVDSEPGHGATFRFELPVEASSAASPAREPGARTAAPSVRRARILVVDDEPEVASTLVDLLDAHDVDVAPDGHAALRQIAAMRYDVVLSDVRMPDLDAPAFYRELERSHRHVLPRLVFLTGDTLADDVRDFIARTGAPVLAKPFDFEKVVAVVERLLTASTAARS